MKKKIFLSTTLLLIISSLFANSQIDSFFKKTDSFLKKNVKNGLVNYEGIKSNPTELNNLVSQISTMKLTEKQGNTHKAFYINAYNILVIKGIVNNLPTKSPLDTDGFFDKKKYKIANEFLVLNDIENKKIRAVYHDARIHFVLVCAAKGCPLIMNYAYMPSQLDKQLESRTKQTLNDNSFVRIKSNVKTVLISEIFKWYKADFTTGGKTIIMYLNQYRTTTTKISEKYKQDYYPYNWKLNKQ